MFLWDSLCFLLIVFHLVLIPLVLCFDIHISPYVGFITRINWFILFLDIVRECNTSFVSKGELVTS
jgi:hypothetical protein